MKEPDFIEQIPDSTAIFEAYCGPLKIDNNGEAKARCPMKDHEDKNPSFTVNVYKSVYKCFGCQKSGGIISFIQEMEGLSASEAAKIIKDYYRIGNEAVVVPIINKPRVKTTKPETKFIPDDEITKYQHCLHIENLQIKDRLIREWGIDDDLIMKYRLGFDGNRVTIPIMNAQGRFLNVRKYQFDSSNRDKVISYREGYGDAKLFPFENLKSETIHICEGEKDCLVAMSHGFNAVTGTGGAGTFKEEWVSLFKDKGVVILYDTDQAGRKGARCVIKALIETAKWVKDVNLGVDKDVADYFNKYGKTVNDLMELCEKTEKVVVPSEEPEEKDEKPTAASLALNFLNKFYLIQGKRYLRYWCGTFCLWTGKFYRKLKDDEMKVKIFQYLQEDEDLQHYATNSHVRDIQSNLEALVFIAENTKPESWLNSQDGTFISMDNGILHLNFDAKTVNELALIPHDPDFFTFSSLPYQFDPTSKCDIFKEFLDCVLPSDQKTQDVLQQWFGYALLPDARYHKFAILHGPGANGKSVVAGTYSALLGNENCCSIPLESFSSNHALEELVGKKANITFEFSDTDRIAEGVLKAISVGDPIQINPKFKAPFTTALMAKLTFCVNILPRFGDKSDGIWRRILLLPFEVVIPESKQDRNLLTKIKTELPGVFNWSFEGLLSLVGTGEFAEAVTSSDAKNTYRLENSSARMFLTEECELSASTETPSNIFYNAYRRYCVDFGFKPVSNVVLGKELKNVYPKIIRTLKRNGNNRWWSYEGIRVNERYTTVSIS